MKRRNFLKGLAALPIAAALPALANKQDADQDEYAVTQWEKEGQFQDAKTLERLQMEILEKIANPPLVLGPEMTATEVLRRRDLCGFEASQRMQTHQGLCKYTQKLFDDEVYRLLTNAGS